MRAAKLGCTQRAEQAEARLAEERRRAAQLTEPLRSLEVNPGQASEATPI